MLRQGRGWWATTNIVVVLSILLLSVAVGASPTGVAADQSATTVRAATGPGDACPADTSFLLTIPTPFGRLYPNRQVIAGVGRDRLDAIFYAGYDNVAITYVIVTAGPTGDAQFDFRPRGVRRGVVHSADQQPITRLTFCTVASTVQTCVPAPLGTATDFNLFILGDLTQQNSDVEGRLAVGGRATIANYSAGAALPVTSPAQDVLVVGGALTFNQGVVAGNAVSGGAATLTNATFDADGRYRQGNLLDFATAASDLRTISTAYAGLPTNGTTRVEYGQVILTGSDPTLDVFAVSGADLSAANSMDIQVPAGATVLVNVAGTDVHIQNAGFALDGVGPSHVLYNFSQAAALRLENVGVQGSILAPSAAIAFANGVVAGTLVGASLTGPGQANRAPFTGCLLQT